VLRQQLLYAETHASTAEQEWTKLDQESTHERQELHAHIVAAKREREVAEHACMWVVGCEL